jgi:hypothetical protein
MDVCVRLFFVCIVLCVCVQVAALQRADPPLKESYRLCKTSRNLKATEFQQRAIEP